MNYSENVTLTDLPSSLLARWSFDWQWAPEEKHRCEGRAEGRLCHVEEGFPRAIAELVGVYGVRDLLLSFSKGYWPEEGAGRGNPSVPAGAHVRVSLPDADWAVGWGGLRRALSGLFCGSLELLDDSKMVELTEVPLRVAEVGIVSKMGTLSREAVCTENLASMLKLLPCRTRTGLAALLHPPANVLRRQYHAMTLHMVGSWDSRGELEAIGLRIGVSFLMPRVTRPRTLADSAEALHGMLCAAAFEGSSAHWEDLPGCPIATAPTVILSEMNLGFEAAAVVSRVLGQDPSVVEPLHSSPPGDVSEAPPAVILERHLTESRRGLSAKSSTSVRNSDSSRAARVFVADIIPHFLEPLFSTLHVAVLAGASHPSALAEETVLEKMSFSVGHAPAMEPSVLEVVVIVPPNSTVVVGLQLWKRFLKLEDFPPDPSRGWDVTGPMAWVEGVGEWGAPSPHYIAFGGTSTIDVPQPDFSMPFNVITLTSTLIAFFLGTTVNVLVRKSHTGRKLSKAGQ